MQIRRPQPWERQGVCPHGCGEVQGRAGGALPCPGDGQLFGGVKDSPHREKAAPPWQVLQRDSTEGTAESELEASGLPPELLAGWL